MTYATWSAKTSAITEIEELPQSWRVEPLCALLKEIEAPNRGNLEQNLLSLSYGRIVRRDINSNDGLLPESFETYQIVEPSDIVLRLTDLQNDQRSLRVGYVTERGIITSAYLALRANYEASPKYLYYLLHAYDLMKIFYGLGGGVRQSMKYADMKWLPMAVPPTKYQADIVDFLDRETAKADDLVAKYERLIELLEEKRAALITQAVTKGLDAGSPMKDSGIVGIGAIPADWDITSIWMLFEIGRGRVISHEDIANNPGDYPVYSSQTENEGEMGRIGTYDFDGDYLTWTTDGARAGTVFQRSGRFNCTNVCGTLKLRKSESANLTYLRHAIDLATKYFVRMDINPKLMNDVMARIRVPVPPVDVQEKIVRVISGKLASNDSLKAKALAAIALIREHRSALITAAVTGQIDVRTYRSKDLEEVVA